MWKKKCSGIGIDVNEKCTYTQQFVDDLVIDGQDKDNLDYMTRNIYEEYEKLGIKLDTGKAKHNNYVCRRLQQYNTARGLGKIIPCNEYN